MPTTTLPAPSATFDPAEWLSRFESIGGGYYLTPENGTYLCWVNAPDSRAVKSMADALTDAERDAIRDHLSKPRPDAAILDAWERRQRAYEQYNVLPFADCENGQYSPEERACWDVIDAAEKVIRSAVAITPRGIELQVWTALAHSNGVDGREENAAANRADLDYFDQRDQSQDWDVRLLLSAIRSLRAMEA